MVWTLSTTIFVIKVIKMLWTHEWTNCNKPQQTAVALFLTPIMKSNKAIPSMLNHYETPRREQRFLYPYRWRQIGDITANCGKNYSWASFFIRSLSSSAQISVLFLFCIISPPQQKKRKYFFCTMIISQIFSFSCPAPRRHSEQLDNRWFSNKRKHSRHADIERVP